MNARGKVVPDPGFALLAALAGFALTLLAFWPGYLSWDSAYQWAQARGAMPLDATHPPVMVRLWMGVRSVLPDPGGLLVLQAALWWGALALFANALGGGGGRRALTVLLIGLWPPLLALLPHLWKDVWMAGFFLLAVAALAVDQRRRIDAEGGEVPGLRWILVACGALAIGCAFRLNALPAVLPLAVWMAVKSTTLRPHRKYIRVNAWMHARLGRHVRTSLLIPTFLGLIVAVGVLLNQTPHARPVAVWPSIAMWDIAAVSIAEDRVLFPPDWIDPALTVADLRRDFDPAVNVPSFAAGQLKLNYYYDYTPDQFAELRSVWLALPLQHTEAYFAHRARLSAFLFGLRQAEHPDSLVLAPDIVGFAGNPPLARNDGALNRWLQPKLSALVDTPLFAGWLYLVVAAGLVARWAWRRDGGFGALSGVVALSALLLAAPLAVLSPSSDFRYLMWSVVATGLALALSAAAPQRPQ
jgi:hypothetical protein